MRELLVKKFPFVIGVCVLLIVAFLAGGIALSSVSAASSATSDKCEQQKEQCKGTPTNPAMIKAIVLIKSVSGNRIQGVVQQAADNVAGTIIIVTTANTEYKPDQSAVAPGKTIFVVGTVNQDKSVTAQTLGAYDPTEADIGGVITSIKGSVLTIQAKDSTRTILLTASTTYALLQPGTKETTPTTVGALKVGGSVEVSGKLNSDGSLTAASVMILPADAQGK